MSQPPDPVPRRPTARPPGLGPHCVGTRVVVRRVLPGRTGPTGGPALTDVLGTMTSWDGESTVVQPEDGPAVVIAIADIVSGKPVPPRPSVRLRVSAEEAERRAVEGWPPVVREPLGAWLLRASGGFSARANSTLVLGDPGLPLADALERVRSFSVAHRLPPWAQVVVGSPEHAALESAGWVLARPGEADTCFQVASVAAASRSLRGLDVPDAAEVSTTSGDAAFSGSTPSGDAVAGPASRDASGDDAASGAAPGATSGAPSGDDARSGDGAASGAASGDARSGGGPTSAAGPDSGGGPAVGGGPVPGTGPWVASTSARASSAWLADDARAAAAPEAARAVLEGPDEVCFVSVTAADDPGTVVAKGRVSHARDWAGITDVWVSPVHRRRGLALVVLRSLLQWSAERGATTTYLQVRGDNPAALALYDRLGYRTHHEYRYLAAP